MRYSIIKHLLTKYLCPYYCRSHNITDRDLAPINRTESNLWQKKFFEALEETRHANKGLRRLNKKLKNK